MTLEVSLGEDCLLTVIQPLNFDLAQVEGRGHADVEGALGDGVSSVTDSDGHVALR